MRQIWALHGESLHKIYPCNYNPFKSFVKTKEWFYSTKVVEGLLAYIKISFPPNVVEQNAIKDKFSLPTSNLLFQILWSKRGISDHMFQPIRWWEKYGKHASRLSTLRKVHFVTRLECIYLWKKLEHILHGSHKEKEEVINATNEKDCVHSSQS
jgi:hypothetical protein